MMKLRILIAVVLVCTADLFACGTREVVHKVTGDETVIITGTVHIYGSEPHTYVGIVSEDGSRTYAVYPHEKGEELRALQGRLIEFTVRFLEKSMGEGSLYLRDGTVTPFSWIILTP
ncbi:hypothetical protein ACYULU_00950 [Breznakiellaceae bacterium SP9]